MTVNEAMSITLRYVFSGDATLNWLLGFALVFFPSTLDGLLGRRRLAPELLYQVVGGGFLLFAVWQTVVVIRRRIGPPGLAFAALMAEIPVVLLAVALVFMNLDLLPVWRVVLWIGNGYMLLLGVWYMFLARRMVIDQMKPGTET
jgi:hypothetical protein